MTKKEALLKLKVAFRNANISTYKMKEIRDLYTTVKELPITENTSVDKQIESKVNTI